ncbi:MAG: ABC transporter ATP-binding protein [Elusimicrobiota bacterium]
MKDKPGERLILDVRDLKVEYFGSGQDKIPALRGASIKVHDSECVGIAGESGSGKSTLALALMNLIDKNEGRICGGKILFSGASPEGEIDIASLKEKKLAGIRGSLISLITQDPYTSFNPVIKIGRQLKEVYDIHNPEEAPEKYRKKIFDILSSVNLGPPEKILDSYPHQLSGGMLQRASMAAALLNDPGLLIADEPTSSLDVTVQKKIIQNLKQLQEGYNLSLIFISHDLNLISEIADRIYILYAGKVVESGRARDIFENPRHPYTRALLKALPSMELKKIESIPGSPPLPGEIDTGCPFSLRCPVAFKKCFKQEPDLKEDNNREWACFKE